MKSREVLCVRVHTTLGRLHETLLVAGLQSSRNEQAAGLIHYSRGKITVLDRAQLETRVCECYRVVKRESDRLLSRKHALAEEVS